MQNLQIIDERQVLGRRFTVYGTPEEPLFLASDVANWIEHTNSRKMLDTVDEDEKTKIFIPCNQSLQGLQSNTEYNFLTEYGLYEVLMQSRKPIAKKFKKKVKEILKEIRQTGKYETIKTEYKIEPKVYKGEKVLTLDDLAHIFGVNKMKVYNAVRKHNSRAYLLENNELEEFKRHNKEVFRQISCLMVCNSSQSKHLALEINPNAINTLSDLFYTENVNLTNWDKLRLVQLAEDLENVIHRRAIGTEYEKALYMIASKVYVDLGFISEVTDDLSINTAIGWNLQNPKRTLRNELKRCLM